MEGGMADFRSANVDAYAAGEAVGTRGGGRCLRRLVALALGVCALGTAHAERTVFSFVAPNGEVPESGLILGPDGSYYGTTFIGGAFGDGTVFKITSTGAISTLHSFNGADGHGPRGNLVAGSDGYLYGTTFEGGPDSDGTVFRISTAGAFNTVYAFTYAGEEGAAPFGDLVQGADGAFYGTTSTGGDYAVGGLYKVTASGILTVLHSFTGVDGGRPMAGMILGQDGNFYGTTTMGGTPFPAGGPGSATGGGTVFKMTPAGDVSTVYAFTGDTGPVSSQGVLAQTADGTLYGTTSNGGSENVGTVFAVTPAGGFSLLHSFSVNDGAQPQAGLAVGGDGALYGTTVAGDPSAPAGNPNPVGAGMVFRITRTGEFAVVHSFSNADGSTPMGALLASPDGNLYGTTQSGGAGLRGTVFKLNGSAQLSTLFAFREPDGALPSGKLTTDGLGRIVGTTLNGGDSGLGVLFGLGTDGTFDKLLSFDGTTGAKPLAGAVQDSGGVYYGTTASGGQFGLGALYSLTPGGTATLLHSFNGMDGAGPRGELVHGLDGAWYGTASGTTAEGTSGAATVFRVDGTRAFSTLYTFPAGPNGTVSPVGQLALDTTGLFYGVTTAGGQGAGSIFTMKTGGTFTDLHDLSGNEGSYPIAGLTRGLDGNFYGSTGSTLFRITSGGSLTLLYTFTGGKDGGSPGPLLLGSDGSLYGTTQYGGNASPIFQQSGYGTVFQLTQGGTLTTLYRFSGGDGNMPQGGLTQGPDGNLYGSTASGGAGNLGAIFEIDGPPLVPVQLQAVPDDGRITLSWKAAGGATQYNVYMGTAAAAESATPVQSGVQGTSTVISGLQNGTTYYFTVNAGNTVGSSVQSAEVSATPAVSSGSSGSSGGGSGSSSSGSGSTSNGSSGGGALSPMVLLILGLARLAPGLRARHPTVKVG